MPLSVCVDLLNVIPLGSGPLYANVGVGAPVAVTMNEPAIPTAKVVLFALVICGGAGT